MTLRRTAAWAASLLAVIGVVTSGACAIDNTEGPPLGDWVLVEVQVDDQNVPLPDDLRVVTSLWFGQAAVVGPCGTYETTDIQLGDGAAEFGEFTHVGSECSPEASEFETTVMSALGRVTNYLDPGTRMALVSKGIMLTYDRVEELPPAATYADGTWRVASGPTGDPLPRKIKVRFSTDGRKYVARTGCRTLRSPLSYVYGALVSDEAPPPTTCPRRLRAQDELAAAVLARFTLTVDDSGGLILASATDTARELRLH